VRSAARTSTRRSRTALARAREGNHELTGCDLRRETPLLELQRLLAAGHDRIAVVRNGKLAGVVTRGDVLEALGERAAAIRRPAVSLADELAGSGGSLRSSKPSPALSETYDGVYLVGGTVRTFCSASQLRRRHRR